MSNYRGLSVGQKRLQEQCCKGFPEPVRKDNQGVAMLKKVVGSKGVAAADNSVDNCYIVDS